MLRNFVHLLGAADPRAKARSEGSTGQDQSPASCSALEARPRQTIAIGLSKRTRKRSASHRLPFALLLLATLLPQNGYAGQNHASAPSSRIFGGTEVPKCAWTSVASFGFCTGNLVHPRVVLSAAHCNLENRAITVQFSGLHEGADRVVEVEYCRSNPDFNGEFGKGADWAYCVLKESVNDIPVIPVLSECEYEYWQQYALKDRVMMVGYGRDEKGMTGIKREVLVPVREIKNNEIKAGGEGKAGCFGDSGGPAFVQLPDRSWRSMGIISYTHGACGNPEFLSVVPNALSWLEQNLASEGIDLTPCTDSNGRWSPGAECGDFPLAPQLEVCSSTIPRGGRTETCASPFADPRVDDSFPMVGGQGKDTVKTSNALNPAVDSQSEDENAAGCSLHPTDPPGLSALAFLSLIFFRRRA